MLHLFHTVYFWSGWWLVIKRVAGWLGSKSWLHQLAPPPVYKHQPAPVTPWLSATQMHHELFNAPIATIATSVTLHQEVQLLKWTTVNPFYKQQHLVLQLMLNPVIAWVHQTCINCKKNCTKSDLQHQRSCTSPSCSCTKMPPLQPEVQQVQAGGVGKSWRQAASITPSDATLHGFYIFLCTRCKGAPQCAPNATPQSHQAKPKCASKVDIIVELASHCLHHLSLNNSHWQNCN